MTKHSTAPIAITLGDPAGIGPEVIARVYAAAQGQPFNAVVVGCAWSLEQACRLVEEHSQASPGLRVEKLSGLERFKPAAGVVPVLDIGVEKPQPFRYGAVQAGCGAIAVACVETAIQLALAGSVSAMVTCPLNKEAIHAAGFTRDIGHQEILARMTGSPWTATLLMTPGLKVVHLSTHKSLIEAARYVTQATIEEKLVLTQETLARWGLTSPRIAIAALNPHGGEGGLLGREEIEEIAPAVASLKAGGMNVVGPIPADSVFNRAICGEFDVVLALYHDQGHIAIKVHNFAESVTATLGIPFVRTSVDHGTAFDIAGKGVADPRSLLAALNTAAVLVAGELGTSQHLSTSAREST